LYREQPGNEIPEMKRNGLVRIHSVAKPEFQFHEPLVSAAAFRKLLPLATAMTARYTKPSTA
jgi:hypothetical protein